MIYLATDPDREGEAISWHLKELLQLPDDKSCRVTFNEITQKRRSPVHRGSPGDRPASWWTRSRRGGCWTGSSVISSARCCGRRSAGACLAGRVQSVATRLVVEREEEIRAFLRQEYWTLDAQCCRASENRGAFVGPLSR